MGDHPIRVLLVGTGDDFGTELESEDFEVARIANLAALGPGADQDAVIVALDDPGPLEALETLRLKTPAAAVLVLTTSDREADGAVALHAGAEDHLGTGEAVHELDEARIVLDRRGDAPDGARYVRCDARDFPRSTAS